MRERGRLAGAVRPQQAEDAAPGNLEGEVLHRDVAGEGLPDPPEDDGLVVHGLSWPHGAGTLRRAGGEAASRETVRGGAPGVPRAVRFPASGCPASGCAPCAPGILYSPANGSFLSRRDARHCPRRAQHRGLRHPADPRRRWPTPPASRSCPSSPGATSSPRCSSRFSSAESSPAAPSPPPLGDRLRLRLQLDRLLPRPRADPGVRDRPGPLHLPRDRGPPRRPRGGRAPEVARPPRRARGLRRLRAHRGRRPGGRPLPLSGIAWALLAALVYASYIVLSSRFGAGVPARVLALHLAQAAAALCVAFALADGGLSLPPRPAGPPGRRRHRASSRRSWP